MAIQNQVLGLTHPPSIKYFLKCCIVDSDMTMSLKTKKKNSSVEEKVEKQESDTEDKKKKKAQESEEEEEKEVDILSNAAMENAYYICHNVQDLLRCR